MKKNRISKNWINKQRRDIYVRQSKVDGYRSRAVYKLIELNDKYKISIRSNKHTFYFACKFDSKNFTISMNKDTKVSIENYNEDQSLSDDENLKKNYLNFIFDHLKKSKIVNVQR